MKRLIGSFMVVSLLASGAAFATPQQQDNHDHDHDRDRIEQRHDDRGPDRHDDHRNDRRDDRRSAHHDDHRNDRHGPPFHRGERLAPDHRGNRVADYRKHHLKQPTRGHEWRRVDNRYVLIAIATGLIASVVGGG